MTNIFKSLFGLVLSSDEQKILEALESSNVDSKRVVGRGTLVLNASQVTASEKFRKYSKQASAIVANHQHNK